ncbi:MAG: hypothetical protein IIW48_07440 [Clostridia bacterium]|nr:hypothetical protein [Clostridia bacterium]
MINITVYLDGQTKGMGYKYIITKGCTSWRAYRTAKGLKYFLDNFGLKINPAHTQLHDYREIGHGRVITMICDEKIIDDGFGGFWDISEVPKEAKPYYDVVNAEYVQCYILDEGHKVTTYKPNPNAKEVYKPLDYTAMAKLIG